MILNILEVVFWWWRRSLTLSGNKGYGVANISVRIGTEHVLDGFSGMTLIVDPDHDAWNRERGKRKEQSTLCYLGLCCL